MKLIIVTGLSGSGKSVALRTLEDEAFYCVDNLPPKLLPAFIEFLQTTDTTEQYSKAAVGIDVRTNLQDLQTFLDSVDELRTDSIDLEVVFFFAENATLIKRFSETRRRHPLSSEGQPLVDAINAERQALESLRQQADVLVNTTEKNVHELRTLIINHIEELKGNEGLSVLIQSFGFKHGIPTGTDFIFDVRCLQNPHWVAELRNKTGLQQEVQQYLQAQTTTRSLIQDISDFINKWLPCYVSDNRRYMTISIGCTGGQHRSVYVTEQIAASLRAHQHNATITVKHCQLERHD